MTCVTALLAYAAFALLALSQERHWETVAGGRLPAALDVRWRRRTGAALLAGTLLSCLAVHGPGFGAILWVLLLALGAFGVAMTLTWWPALLKPVARRSL